jgi:hypothetical protein
LKARIVDNLLELCERIQGQEVELVFVCQDAFEAIDKNYWLPECCWDEIKPATNPGGA